MFLAVYSLHGALVKFGTGVDIRFIVCTSKQRFVSFGLGNIAVFDNDLNVVEKASGFVMDAMWWT